MMDLMTRVTRKLVVISASALFSLVGMGIGATLAQQAQPVQPALAPKGAGVVQGGSVLDDWVKVCNTDPVAKKEICRTMFDLRTSTGQFLANFTLMEATGETRRIVRLIVPTGLLLQEGLTIRVDEGKPEAAKFAFCAPDGCVSDMVASDAFFAAIKKGKVLAVGAVGQSAAPVQFQFPLDTFNGANQGKPLDEEALKKRQQALQQEVEQTQNSLAEQLKAAQRKAQQQGQ